MNLLQTLREAEDVIAALWSNSAVRSEYNWDKSDDATLQAIRDAITELTAPPSQGKVERAREILKAACAPYMYQYWEDRGFVSIGTAEAAITQALTERGTDGSTE